MNKSQKTKKSTQKIFIPTLGEIPISQGTVPISGATATMQKINEEFARATKEKIISPPPDQNTSLH